MAENKVQHWYLHVDLDAFFASVEQLDNPQFRGKPVIVGGRPEDRRGVVSTASYEARKFGVHSAMPVSQAYKLCPHGIFVHGRMQRYAQISYQIMTIFQDYSPDVLQMSIDEAFIDLTGTEKLFGPPEETAMKIKQRVRQETGLTVSIGLAQTQYLAKIASGYSKPDGFYFVKPGDEEKFMLSLPLDKVWGAGKKTLESLKYHGYKTTRDIYEKDLEILQITFGNNMGSFLYNAVRGNENMSFGGEAKKHSISAETTFPYDINDIYTAETAIMNLCYGVYFRLLKQNGYSRTATIKIRYEDFSTVSIQETLERNILTLDSFFEISKNLFERKYEKGRGIRLIGVGFDNVEKEDRPYQQELFEDEKIKNNKIEKSILQLSKKHPEIKIQKARMLKTKVLILALLSIFVTGIKSAEASEIKSTESTGAGTVLNDTISTPDSSESNQETIFNFELNDTRVDFILDGYWLAQFENNASLNFGKFNSLPVFSWGVPVFKQEVDINFWAMLDNQYFFQTDFADAFTKNTISMGYKSDGFLRNLTLSNRNITMNKGYAASCFGFGLEGGENQAPGIQIQLENGKFSGDFLLRYDMTQLKSATFYGMNSVNDIYIQCENFIHGNTFILPENSASQISLIKDIYVESKNGSFTGKNGKKYKKISESQYQLYPVQSKILLSPTAAASINQDSWIPEVLVTFTSDSTPAQIIDSCGNWTDSQSFFGKIQNYFSELQSINLQDFVTELTTKVENENALILQNSTGFSPFSVCNIYDCGIITDGDLSLIHKSSENTIKDFSVRLSDDVYSNTFIDFTGNGHKYAEIINNNSTDNSLQNPENRYPLASSNPEIYLNIQSASDAIILLRTYNSVTSLNIGTKAIEGTVQVYKNDILVTGSVYTKQTGTVDLSEQITNTDKIYITWQEDSSDFSGGNIVAGAGARYQINDFISTNVSMTSRWPLAPFKKYSTADNLQSGFIALAAGLDFSKNNFSFSNKTAAAFQNQNATGNLLLISQESAKDQTYYHSISAGFPTKNIPQLNSTSDFDIYPELKEEYNFSPATIIPIQDTYISGLKIPLSFDFFQGEKDKNNWAAVDIQLSYGNLLKNSSELEISLMCSTDLTGYEIFLQLGNRADSVYYGENSSSIPTWKINNLKNSQNVLFDPSSNKWQTVIIKLSDSERSRLISSYDARLIIVRPENCEIKNESGVLYFGPYEPHVKSIFTSQNSNISVTSRNTINQSPSAKDLLISDNYSSALIWDIQEPLTQASESAISAASYFKQTDIFNYSELSFDFAYHVNENFFENITDSAGSMENPEFTYILDSDALSVKEGGNSALTLKIYQMENYISKNKGITSNYDYHQLKINLRNKTVTIDNQQIAENNYSLEIDPTILPDRQKIVIQSCIGNELYYNGFFVLDNTYCSKIEPYASIQNNTNINYSKTGDILKIGNYSFIKNPSITFNSTQKIYSSALSENEQAGYGISGYGNASVTVAGIIFNADASLSYDSKDNLSSDILLNAGHNIKTESPLFSIISASETFRFNNKDKNLKKSDSIEINFEKLKFPFLAKFSGNSTVTTNIKNQDFSIQSSFTPAILKSKLNVSASLKASQKCRSFLNDADNNNYFQGYYNSSAFQFSLGKRDAENRKTAMNAKISLNLPWYKITPSLEYNFSNTYEASTEKSITDTQFFKLSLPVSLENNVFSFNALKSASGRSVVNTDYLDHEENYYYINDFNKTLESINERVWFFKAIPIYDLFSNYKPFMNSGSAASLLYSTRYEFLWKRNLLNSVKDLYIPSALNFAISRDYKTSEILSDIYQIKLVLSQNSINLFGKDGFLPLFKWYAQDEIQSNLSVILKIPSDNPENTIYQTSFYTQMLFLITDKASIQAAMDFIFSTDYNWNLRTTLIWSRPGTSSPIINLLNLIPVIKNSQPQWQITRKDTLNIDTGTSSLVNKQNYEYYHNTEIKFLEHYTVITGIGAGFNYIQNSADTLSVKFTLGGKMEF